MIPEGKRHPVSFTSPGTSTPLLHQRDGYLDPETGACYPMIDGTPVLLPAALNPAKRELIKFWGSCPNGSLDAATSPADPAFFDRADAARIRVHTDLGIPWYMDAIGFERHRGEVVLEVGCGIGGDTVRWAERRNEVYAVDLNLPSVLLARQALCRKGLSATLAVADAENLLFPDAAFDFVYSFGVLHHSPDTPRAIHEAVRVLRPGGELQLMLYHRQSVLYYWRVLFWFGFVGGYRKRFPQPSALLSYVTEDQAKGGGMDNPLTQAFTRDEVQAMLHEMQTVAIDTHYIDAFQLIPPVPPFRTWRALVHAAESIMPATMKHAICSRWGWNLLVRATK